MSAGVSSAVPGLCRLFLVLWAARLGSWACIICYLRRTASSMSPNVVKVYRFALRVSPSWELQ